MVSKLTQADISWLKGLDRCPLESGAWDLFKALAIVLGEDVQDWSEFQSKVFYPKHEFVDLLLNFDPCSISAKAID